MLSSLLSTVSPSKLRPSAKSHTKKRPKPFQKAPSAIPKIALSPLPSSPSFPFMGKRLPSATNLQDYARVAAERIRTARRSKPLLKSLASPIEQQQKEKEEKPGVRSIAGGGGQGKAARGGMEGAAERRDQRVPLAEVVSDCVRRWFQDALKEARAGDAAMQVLVGQMYQSGYGVARNEQKAKAWMTKASKYRSSVWKVSNKRPGYNASDSDSDDVEDDKS